MAVQFVRPVGDAAVKVGSKGELTYSRTFNVRSTVRDETKEVILLCGLLPVYGSPYPTNFAAVCHTIDLHQNKSEPHLWECACAWSTLQDGNPKDKQQQPDQRRPEWSGGFIAAPNYRLADLDGKPFEDTAHTPFDPPPSIPIFVRETVVRRYESSIDFNKQRGFLNATNTDSWQDAQPGEGLVANITWREVYEWGQYWFDTTYTIHTSPLIYIQGGAIGGFDPYYVLCAGPRYLDAKGKPQSIASQGIFDGRAQKLDSGGHVVKPGDNPYYLKFRVVNKCSFGDLKLTPPWS